MALSSVDVPARSELQVGSSPGGQVHCWRKFLQKSGSVVKHLARIAASVVDWTGTADEPRTPVKPALRIVPERITSNISVSNCRWLCQSERCRSCSLDLVVGELRSLDIGSNFLSGSLPASISNLKSLQYVKSHTMKFIL